MLNTNDGAAPTGLRTGTKVAVIIAALLLAVAIFFFVSPTSFTGKDGSLFACGSPMSPNTSGLAKGQCNIVEGHARDHALLALALALITAALGYVLFGTHGPARGVRSRDRYDDYDDDIDDEDDDEPRSSRSARPARRDSGARPVRRARLGDEDAPVRRTRRDDVVADDERD